MKYKSYFKVVAAFAMVLVIATSLWFASPVMLCYAADGYGGVDVGIGGGGSGGVGELYPGLTYLRDRIDYRGVLIADVTAESPDKLAHLTINKGTKALDKWGNPLSGIIMIEMRKPPTPPPGYALVGQVYDFRPDGATFEPAIALTLGYEPADITTGVSEEDLVLAYWDGDKGVMLPTTVNTVANTGTADVPHFTPFGILAKLPPPPTAFAVTTLTVSPTEVDIGETVTISVHITNIGDLTSSYEVTLKVNEVAVATQEVSLAGSARQEVIFATTKDVAGTYTVDVNGLVDKFVVKAPAAFEVSQLSISAAEVNLGEEVTISTVVTNIGDTEGSYTVILKINGVIEATEDLTLAGGASQEITATMTKDAVGTYEVDINGQVGKFVVKAMTNWWLIGAIIGGIIIIGIAIWGVTALRRVRY